MFFEILWLIYHFVIIFGIAICSEALQDEAKNVRQIAGQLLAFSSTELGKTFELIYIF